MLTETSFRLPQGILRALDHLAKQRGVPKSQLVREALEQYLGADIARTAQKRLTVRELTAPFIGAINLYEVDADEVSARIRTNNWRD